MKAHQMLVGGVMLAVALFLTPVSHATAACTFTTVGTTMTLDGDCTTDATILIPNGMTLDGDGHTITAIDPSGGHFKGAVVMNGGSTAHVTNLTVTASGLANVCDGGADRLRGILFDGASGSITSNTVENLNQGASGCQEGNAIEARNYPFDGTHPGTKTVEISENTATAYQKNGITANGDVEVTITDNTVVGAGRGWPNAQNGIQLGFGAIYSSISGNNVTNNLYTQSASKGWVATGILIYQADVTLTGNAGVGGVQSYLTTNNAVRRNQADVLVIP